ncbi:MAG: class I SAM-dependent methyltransferase [Candidatus Binataceae bacterium]
MNRGNADFAERAVRDTAEQNDERSLRVRATPNCYLCGQPGVPLYRELHDRLFDTLGAWSFKQCPAAGCGLVWQDPMPVEADIGKAYREYFTHQSYEPHKPTLDQRLFRMVKPHLYPPWRIEAGFPRDHLPPIAGGRLLDVGCGDGQLLRALGGSGWQAEGIDFDPAAVERARSQGLAVRVGMLPQLDCPNGSFDAVVMDHVIEHVHDPLEVLREVRRVLRRGGRLIATTPNLESLGHRHFASAWAHLDPPRHLHIFNLTTLRSLAERAGFHRPAAVTTARNVAFVFLASRAIEGSGRFVWGARPSLGQRLYARSCELGEWLMIRINPRIGEEILMLADKNGLSRNGLV